MVEGITDRKQDGGGQGLGERMESLFGECRVSVPRDGKSSGGEEVATG